MPRNLFLKKFIKSIYNKGLNKRRTQERNAYKIAGYINSCLKKYDKKLQFEEQEIFKAFKKCGYILMTSEGEFSWERFHNNHTLTTIDKFINIDVQSNKDLKAVHLKRKENWSVETIKRLDNLKISLDLFWEENKQLLDR